VWAYEGYWANSSDLPNKQGCDILVITFAHDRVIGMQLVNRQAAEIIASNLKLRPDDAIASNP